MDEAGDERYPESTYDGGIQAEYVSSCRQKLPVRNSSFSTATIVPYSDAEEDENTDAEDELLVEDYGGNSIRYIDQEEEEEEDMDDDEDNYDDENKGEDGDEANGISFSRFNDDEVKRHPKKRKLKSLISTYEFAPRIASAPSIGRSPLTDWNEHETFVLLEAWGDKFLEHGRKSLRSDEWLNVAEKVSKMSKVERTDTQCRNRLDTLKKKYKKEKLKITETNGKISNWVYFSKMDMLMSASPRQGEFTFASPKEQINSPRNSESYDAKEDDSEGLPPKKRRSGRDRGDGCSSYRLLADSICKFSDIYEKTENRKRVQEMELEKMKMELQRDLEAQRRKLMEKLVDDITSIVQNEGEKN